MGHVIHNNREGRDHDAGAETGSTTPLTAVEPDVNYESFAPDCNGEAKTESKRGGQMTATPQQRVNECANLDELCAVLREFTDEDIQSVATTNLPTYGREYQQDTEDIWSWDDGRVLIGTAQDGSAWGIGSRCTTCGAYREKPARTERKLRAVLQNAIETWPQYDSDGYVNGGDLVEWFGEWRLTAREVIN